MTIPLKALPHSFPANMTPTKGTSASVERVVRNEQHAAEASDQPEDRYGMFDKVVIHVPQEVLEDLEEVDFFFAAEVLIIIVVSIFLFLFLLFFGAAEVRK